MQALHMSKEPMGNEGAKQARAAIKQFHHCLNSPALVPIQCYTPSEIGAYPVLWVNQIVALMFSHNYVRIPFCIRRAYSGFDQIADKPVFDSYRKVAFDYLCQVAYFLENFTDLEEENLKSQIPAEIYGGGSKTPSVYSVQNQSFEKV